MSSSSPTQGAPAGHRLRGRGVVCIGTADWRGGLWTNQQHLMSRLARENRVLFTESLGLRRPTLAARDVRRMARRLRSGLAGPRTLDGVAVVSPLVLPLHASAAARRVNEALLRRLVARAAAAEGIERPILWAYNPHAHALAGRLGEQLVVYHCVDDIAAQPHIDEPSFAAAERAMVEAADLVLASSAPLATRMRELGGRRVAYVPNVADVDHFARAGSEGEPPELDGLGRPRLLFAGAVVEKKLDLPLIAALARRRPDWTLVLVGPVGEGDPRGNLGALAGLPNVHLLGAQPFARLPAFLGAADVCLIPYALNRYTGSVFPMKVYEYLAAGRPVVATPLPSLKGVEGVAFAADPGAFEAAVEAALADTGPAAEAARRRLAAEHSWSRRLEEIGVLVHEAER